MITLRDPATKDVIFTAHGMGVKVPEPCTEGLGSSQEYQVLCLDRYQKREWCETQGWIPMVDFMAPGTVGADARWWFRTIEQQIEFALRFG